MTVTSSKRELSKEDIEIGSSKKESTDLTDLCVVRLWSMKGRDGIGGLEHGGALMEAGIQGSLAEPLWPLSVTRLPQPAV